MSKIKVMHCFGCLNVGGAETLIVNVLKKIDLDQYKFDFLLFDKSPGYYDEQVKKYGSDLYYTSNISSCGIYKYVKNLIYFFRNHDIDVVHSHMDWQGGFIAYAAHKANIKKIVIHSHSNQEMFKKNILYKILIYINKILIKKYATDCLACSKEAGDSLFLNKYEIIINGIDIEKYLYPNLSLIKSLEEEFNIKEDNIILGNVGSLKENKNQKFIIDVLKEIIILDNRYRLILVGDGPDREYLENYVCKLGLLDYVLFVGIRKEIPEIMHLFDIFLFPSKLEGMGIVGIEAQSSGVHCIVSSSIPHSLDLGLGLVSFLDFKKDKWKKEIMSYSKRSVQINKDLLINSDYNIVKTMNYLIEIYTNDKT